MTDHIVDINKKALTPDEVRAVRAEYQSMTYAEDPMQEKVEKQRLSRHVPALCDTIDQLRAEKNTTTDAELILLRTLMKQRNEEIERLKETDAVTFSLIDLPHSPMSDGDKQQWYGCLQQLLQARQDGKTGIDLTAEWDEHPEHYDGPCRCALCCSYGDVCDDE